MSMQTRRNGSVGLGNATTANCGGMKSVLAAEGKQHNSIGNQHLCMHRLYYCYVHRLSRPTL